MIKTARLEKDAPFFVFIKKLCKFAVIKNSVIKFFAYGIKT